MVVIVTPEEIAEGTVNQDLIELSETEAGKVTLAKYEKIVASKIWAKVDAEQFNDGNDNYVIPEDLKIAAISLIDSFYTYAVVQWLNNGSNKVKQRKIDDFTETYSDNTNAFSYFDIPTDGYILDILKKYMGITEWGYWYVDVR